MLEDFVCSNQQHVEDCLIKQGKYLQSEVEKGNIKNILPMIGRYEAIDVDQVDQYKMQYNLD